MTNVWFSSPLGNSSSEGMQWAQDSSLSFMKAANPQVSPAAWTYSLQGGEVVSQKPSSSQSLRLVRLIRTSFGKS